jgi:hypothetical protein
MLRLSELLTLLGLAPRAICLNALECWSNATGPFIVYSFLQDRIDVRAPRSNLLRDQHDGVSVLPDFNVIADTYPGLATKFRRQGDLIFILHFNERHDYSSKFSCARFSRIFGKSEVLNR